MVVRSFARFTSRKTTPSRLSTSRGIDAPKWYYEDSRILPA
jgi:hypothetical protein